MNDLETYLFENSLIIEQENINKPTEGPRKDGSTGYQEDADGETEATGRSLLWSVQSYNYGESSYAGVNVHWNLMVER